MATRGYFGIGVERISKPLNVGNLFRTAHAFGASFLFAIEPAFDKHRDGPATIEALEREIGLAMQAADADAGQDAPAADVQAIERSMKLSDTSGAAGQVPLFVYPSVAALALPAGCRLVGVELTDDAVMLPSFKHPTRAAYVLGPERGSLSPELTARCDAVVKIPTRFCINVGIAGAIVMYDRITSLGRFAARPVAFGGPPGALPEHRHGEQLRRSG